MNFYLYSNENHTYTRKNQIKRGFDTAIEAPDLFSAEMKIKTLLEKEGYHVNEVQAMGSVGTFDDVIRNLRKHTTTIVYLHGDVRSLTLET